MQAEPNQSGRIDSLFPPLPAFDAGWLPVGEGHRIHYAQRGNPRGIPAIVLHGGPGSGSSPLQAQCFDPHRYRVIQFDQRGSGLSQPCGETRSNQTGFLLRDIETLRQHLEIERWLVVGGSWGATLGAVYAARHRASVIGALLRGLFLTGDDDMQWFFREAATEHPDAWAEFARNAPVANRENLLPWLHRLFSRETSATQTDTAHAWFAWERTLSGLPRAPAATGASLQALCARYRVQSHYLMHRCWLGELAVLKACTELQGLPVLFLHGDRDQICRPVSAAKGHQSCTGSHLQWATGAGHDPYHPAMAALMAGGLDQFARNGQFGGSGKNFEAHREQPAD